MHIISTILFYRPLRTDRKIYIPYRYYLMQQKKTAEQNINAKLNLVVKSGKFKIGKSLYYLLTFTRLQKHYQIPQIWTSQTYLDL